MRRAGRARTSAPPQGSESQEVHSMARPPLLLLVVLACRGEEANTTTPLPPPGRDTIPIAGEVLYVPRGFTINLFAEGQHGARSLALGPGESVFATRSSGGTIVRLV